MNYYQVYYTDKPLPSGAKPDFLLMMPLHFTTEEEALKEAFKLIYRGGIVWKIDGPGGFQLDRAGVESRYRKFRAA